MVRFFSSLRFRLMLLVLLPLVPSLGLVIYTDSGQRHLAASQAQEHALQIAREATESQQEFIASTHQFLSILAQLPAVRDLNPDVCNAFLAEFRAHYLRYTSITVRSAKDATSICRATSKNGPIPAEPGLAHVRALKAGDFAIGDFTIGATSGKSVLPFGYPIRDSADQVQAILMVALDLDVLNQLAAQALLPSGSTLMVNDSTGQVLVRYPNPELWVGKSAADVPVVKAILAHKGEGTVEALGEDQVARLYAFTPLIHDSTASVYVSVGIPSSVAFAEVNDMLTRNLITLGLVAALAIAAAWFMGDWLLLRQVNTLVSLTGRLAKGDLGARAGVHYHVGELDQLAQAFDQMGESLQHQEVVRKQVEDQIRCWSADLERLMNAVSEAISQSQEVSQIVDIVLTRTLSMMRLSAGGVFLKRGGALTLVAQTGLCDEIVQKIQRTQNCKPASSELERLAQSETVEIVSLEPSEKTAGTEREGLRWIRILIKSKGRIFGIMCLACDSNRPIKPHEKGVLAAVGRQIGVAIENAELSEQVQSIAALQERERLSRELHDGLAQVLGYLCIRTDVVSDLVQAAQVDHAMVELQEMQRAVQEAHQDLRESILGLRTTIHPQGGLFAALKEYLHKFSLQTGITVNLVLNGTGRIQYLPEAEVQLLRIIQEALANIRKHSDASQAWVRFERRGEFITVTIEDDGKGFDTSQINQTSQTHFGLQMMRERAEGVGGSLHISSETGHGARISVDLPIRQGNK